MRRRDLVVVLASVVAVLGAQAPVPQQQTTQPPVFRGSTNLVRVDVSVSDRRGDPITDLRKEDFQITEDNIPQAVQTLKFISATGAAPDTDESLPIRSAEHAAEEAAKDDIRVVLIFWDEYHIGEFAPAIRARQALTEFARTAFGPTDLVALMDQLTTTDDIHFSRDRIALVNQIHDLHGRQGVYMPARSAVEEAQLYQMRDVELLRSQVTASALESAIAFLGALKQGRKAILFVSQTIGRVGSSPMDADVWLRKAINLANTNNTTIYTLDPRGLEMSSRLSSILQSLAENTGGRVFANNFPGRELREILKDQSAYYLVGYSSSRNPADGKFHRIKVKVDRPGVAVKARSGYVAPTLAEIESARKPPPPPAPADVERALESVADTPHMPVTGDLWAGAAPGPDGTAQVTIAWTPRAAPVAPKPGADVFGKARVSGPDGRVVFDGPLVQGQMTFPAGSGLLHVRHDTIDPDGGLGARTEMTVDVPDFAHAALSMSTPAVYVAHSPLELRALLGNPHPAAFAGRRFDRSERVLVRFALFGAAAPNATVTATLLSRTGTKLAVLPMTPDRDQRWQLDLPLASIAQGEYVIAIEAAQGATHLKALVPLRIVPE